MIYPYNSYSYSYGYDYGNGTGLVIVLLVAVILAVVLNFTFLSKKNEGKYKGALGKIYNFLCFNKFYAEEIIKLIYIVSAVVITVVGLAMLFNLNIIAGLIFAVVGNVVLRVAYELIVMFIILCRKTVSIDKKIDKISGFYGDDFDDGLNDEDEAESCEGQCCQCSSCCDDDTADYNCQDCCSEDSDSQDVMTSEQKESQQDDSEDDEQPPINMSDR